MAYRGMMPIKNAEPDAGVDGEDHAATQFFVIIHNYRKKKCPKRSSLLEQMAGLALHW